MKISFFVCALSFLLSACSMQAFKPSGVRGVPEEKPIHFTSWIKNLDPKADTGNLPIGLQSPLIHEGIVYAGHNDGHMQAYELDNGRLIWNEYDASGYHGGIIPHKDQIIYGTIQGRVISRQGVVGTIKYSVDLGSSVETKGVIHNGRIFFQTRNHQIFCLDVETGKILWAYKRSVPYLTTLQRASAPVVYKDKLLVGFADGTFTGLSLEEGILLFETKLSNGSKFVDVDNSPFIFADKVYLSPVGGQLSLLDPNTGKILRTSDFQTSRAPLHLNDQLIFGSPTGEIIVTDKNLNVLLQKKISQGTISNIVSFKNFLAVSTTNGEIKIVDQKTLAVMETKKLGHAYSAVFGDLGVSGDNMAVITSRNRLFIFK